MASLDSFLVTCHTNNVKKNGTFVAIKGKKNNGVNYIIDAIKNGAKKIVVQEDNLVPQFVKTYIHEKNVDLIFVKNDRKALAKLSAQAYNYPAKKLKIIGITGTKGKTSTAFILYHILKSCSKKVALLSTVYNEINDCKYKSTLTTPQPDYLHAFFNECIKENIEFIVMEVAAQALSLHRLEGINFDAAIFTNFSQEHGEFYSNLEEYFNAKCLLFKQLKKGPAVFINNDDKWGKKILNENKSFLPFNKNFINNQKVILPKTALIGEFNQYNIVAALSVAFTFNISFTESKCALKSFKGIPGRLQKYQLKNGATCFIDYAHSPSSFLSVLSALRKNTNNLIVVFGCAGDRDKIKRPQMGKIAAEICDKVFITSDNSRSESFKDIIQDIMFGISKDFVKKVVVIEDRKAAIEKACSLSRKNSIVALLGKGPDEYQIIGTHRSYFSEREIILKLQQ